MGDFTVYFNGKRDQTTQTKNTPCDPTEGVSLFLGKPSKSRQAAVAIECYAGFIDEVAIYNYALNEDEIQAAVNGRLPGAAVELRSKLTTTWGKLKAE